MAKWVYSFKEGNADMRALLGGKGANLAEMTNLGLPIPQGFTVTTEACTDYYHNGKQISDEIQGQICDALADLEKLQGKTFGDTENPLLVSVRSGARASMPGMMDTILNLGLTDVSVEGFAKKTGNPRFAYDYYRSFIQMFSDVVMEVPKSLFEMVRDEIKEAKGARFDTDLTADDLKEFIELFKAIYKDKMGEDFPQDPRVQLMEAVKAVFRSWDNERAIVYRRMNDIPSDWGKMCIRDSGLYRNGRTDRVPGHAGNQPRQKQAGKLYAPCRRRPVSYTHLDVYKRQAIYYAAIRIDTEAYQLPFPQEITQAL